ncbi:MAG: thioredoxin domain-containing protein [Acidobacteriota bacterium]|nr:thioredoxin domain-containing protein [Acidobacteriota bacterium]
MRVSNTISSRWRWLRHLADAGRCGSCKASLPPLASPLEVDSAAFNDIVRQASVPILIDFWAAWCGPCRMAAPEVAALAGDVAGRAIVLKVNTEQNPDVTARYRVQSVPYFVLLRTGRVMMERAGVAPGSEMLRWIEQTVPSG